MHRRRLSGLARAAAILVAIPFVFSASTTHNGLRQDHVAIVCGEAAGVLAIMAAMAAIGRCGSELLAALLVIGLGVLQVARGVGSFHKSEYSEIRFEHTGR